MGLRLAGFGPPKAMKMGEISGNMSHGEDGRGRFRSGVVETVRESDPDRVFWTDQ